MPVTAVEDDRIGPAAAVDHIVAPLPRNAFGRARGGQAIIAIARHDRGLRAQLGERDGGAIAEGDRVHPDPAPGIGQHDLVRAAVKAQNELIAIGRRLGDAQLVGPVARNRQRIGVCAVGNDIAAIAAGEDIGVVPRPAPHLIIAQPAKDPVGPPGALDHVIASRGLVGDIALEQGRRIPALPVAEFDLGQLARRERAAQDQLIAGAGEGDHQIGGAVRRRTHFDRACGLTFKNDHRTGNARRQDDVIDPVTRRDHQAGVLRQRDKVVAAAGAVLAARGQIAQIDDVLRIGGALIEDDGAHFRDGKRAAIGKFKAFNRPGLVTAEDRETIDIIAERDHQIAIDIGEGQPIRRDLGTEHDAVDTPAVVHAVAPVADAEAVGIIAEPARQCIRPLAAR